MTTPFCFLAYKLVSWTLRTFFFAESKNDSKTKSADDKIDLQLALPTAQLGLTFQDRSHMFLLKTRSFLPLKFHHSNIYYIREEWEREETINVQAYPAMEYRFTPECITATTDDVVRFLWEQASRNWFFGKSFLTKKQVFFTLPAWVFENILRGVNIGEWLAKP